MCIGLLQFSKSAEEKGKINFLCQNELASSKQLLCLFVCFEAYDVAWNLKKAKTMGKDSVANKNKQTIFLIYDLTRNYIH